MSKTKTSFLHLPKWHHRRHYYEKVSRILAKRSFLFVALIGGWAVILGFYLYKKAPTTTPIDYSKWLKDANEEGAWLITGYTILAGVISAVAFIASTYGEEDQKVRRGQKERIKILDGFRPTRESVTLYGNRSIYEMIIQTLHRLDERKGLSESGQDIRFRVCLLLCSPALDYAGNLKTQAHWGEEFKNKIDQFAPHRNIQMDICYLPVEPMLGFNPMEDFLSVLADFVSKETSADFDKTHKMLCERTKTIHGEITKLSTGEHKDRFTLRPPMLNVPFQIVLVLGDTLKEVIVSFAGREMLERGVEPKGFFSSDPYIVETFYQIYLDYVEQGGRSSFVPPHTRGVVEQHNRQPAHKVTNYLGVITSLEVGNGCFSPALANSSKFTSWVITKVLTKDDNSILDIGSGTGVLALMAQKTLQQLGATSSRIVAVECDENSFQTLLKNCPAASGIEAKKWCLSSKMVNDEQMGGAFVDASDGNKEVGNEKVGQFKVIIADLPFVDVKESLAKDQRFFDPEHKAHKTLFMAVSKNNWLADNGRLITAFSSLGGPDDVLRFERLIAENDLQIVQRVDFHESNYLWIVHVIVKKADFDRDKYWWKELKADDTTPPKISAPVV